MSIESQARFASPRTSRSAQRAPLLSMFMLLLLAYPLFAVARAQLPDSTSAKAGADTPTKPKWPDKFQINWNEYNLGVSTIVIGAAWLTGYASYNQDSLSEEQFQPDRTGKIRDSRFMVSGVLNTKRSAIWQTGIMYDWPVSKWR